MSSSQTPAEHELAELIVTSLNLENISAEAIEPEAALFGGSYVISGVAQCKATLTNSLEMTGWYEDDKQLVGENIGVA